MLAALAPLSGADAKAPKRADAVAQAAALKRGRVTAAGLVEAAIGRLERADILINAVGSPNYDRARAAAAGPHGVFAGVPTLIKNNVEAAGLPWTSGCRALRDRVGKTDSAVVAAIDRAGLISIGRSNLPEFSLAPTTEPLLTGPTRNPWRLDRSAGGSSGGSAAAVAAGVVAVAHGNDGGGSIRIPASNCGLVGLKPSRARMAGETGRKVTDFSVQGCMSRTVRDTAAWLAAMEQPGGGAYPPVGLVTGPSKRRLRIGLARVSSLGAEAHDEVRAVFERTARLLAKRRHRLVAAPCPFDGPAVANAFDTLWSAGAGARLRVAADHLGRTPTAREIEPLTSSWVAHGRSFTPADIAAATATLELLERQHVAQFERFDVVLTPVLGAPALAIGMLSPQRSFDELNPVMRRYVAYTPIENASGACAISLPMGMASDGTPIGMQFAAPPGNERVLLELAYELEHVVGWHRRRPPVWVG